MQFEQYVNSSCSFNMKLNGLLIQKQNQHIQSDEMNACLKQSNDDSDQTHLLQN